MQTRALRHGNLNATATIEPFADGTSRLIIKASTADALENIAAVREIITGIAGAFQGLVIWAIIEPKLSLPSYSQRWDGKVSFGLEVVRGGSVRLGVSGLPVAEAESKIKPYVKK